MFVPKKETENSVIGWKSPSLGIFTWDLHRNVHLTTAEAFSCEHQITWIPGNKKSWRMWMFKGSTPPRSRFATDCQVSFALTTFWFLLLMHNRSLFKVLISISVHLNCNVCTYCENSLLPSYKKDFWTHIVWLSEQERRELLSELKTQRRERERHFSFSRVCPLSSWNGNRHNSFIKQMQRCHE